MQVDPIKPTLKPPGTKRLVPKWDEPLSDFAFNFNLRRYIWALRLCGFLDAAIYIFIAQLTTLMIRAWQGRRMFHRMTGRTVVIGDCPWYGGAGSPYQTHVGTAWKLSA
jgi:hypothetical protein